MQDRMDMGNGLTIDLEPFKRIGMTILSKEDVDRMKKRMAEIQRIKEIAVECGDSESAAKRMRDEGLIVSMSMGRRMWHSVRDSGTKNC